MRSRVGDEVILCCDKIDYYCEIIRITKNETVLKVGEYQAVTTEPEIEVTLYPAILKGDKMEFVVQKCTELGVNAIRPFVSANCECRVTAVRVDRLKKIAEEASKQCGRGIIPDISEVIDFSALVSELSSYDIVGFPYENAKEVDLKSFLRNSPSGNKIAIVVGSEGGFKSEEAEQIEAVGATSVSLGSRIMRAETASVAVLSAVMYEKDEWRIK
jgi:16S rRNA (uracil1498-N3)-methyltransferase